MNVVDKLSNPLKNKPIFTKANEMIDGDNPLTKSMKNLIAMVSQTDSTLILGETGTGEISLLKLFIIVPTKGPSSCRLCSNSL